MSLLSILMNRLSPLPDDFNPLPPGSFTANELDTYLWDVNSRFEESARSDDEDTLVFLANRSFQKVQKIIALERTLGRELARHILDIGSELEAERPLARVIPFPSREQLLLVNADRFRIAA